MVALVLNTRGHRLFERNVMAYRRAWMTIFSGFFEPLFYLFSMGYGLGHFVGRVHGIPYAHYIAPALLASSAMNGAVYDATTNVFWKLRYARLYDSMLATPLGPVDVAVGETAWAQFRGLLYAVGFMITIVAVGAVQSWWGVLAMPASVVIGFGFAGAGIGIATFLRSWQDLELLQIVLLPLFLFSGTFYPLSVYPDWLAWVVRFSPLYNALSLVRSFTLGHVTWYCVLNAAYLLALGVIGIAIARKRMAGLLLS